MKKLFLFVTLISMVSMMGLAQSATHMPTIAGDTIITTSSRDTVFKTIKVTAGYSALGVQVVTKKVSGTVAGKAYLYSSLDGTNYVITDSSSAFVDQTTNTAFFTKSTTPYVYYQVRVQEANGGAATTQSNAVNVYYVLRKYNNNAN